MGETQTPALICMPNEQAAPLREIRVLNNAELASLRAKLLPRLMGRQRMVFNSDEWPIDRNLKGLLKANLSFR
jgi:hypothetical protein